jgi:alpha-tubulin suppressor-like RCC1 family protein
VDVTGLSSGVSAIAAGDEHTCAALSSGGGKCWGRNSSGQLGNGSTANSNVPVSVNSLSEILIGIDAGNEHTCGLTNKGSMVCWGQNNSGQLGDGTYQDKTSPVAVTGISSGATSLATGGSHSCGVVNGTLKCWWDNQYGQLGDGTGNSSYLPVNVFGLVNGVNTISAGGSHSCAVIIPSEVKCWGSSDDGEIGNGIPIQRLTPVLVTGYEGAQTMFIPMVIQGHQGN